VFERDVARDHAARSRTGAPRSKLSPENADAWVAARGGRPEVYAVYAQIVAIVFSFGIGAPILRKGWASGDRPIVFLGLAVLFDGVELGRYYARLRRRVRDGQRRNGLTCP